MANFGELVRRHREAAGIPLNHFAARIGVSPAYWSRIERGIEKPPLNPLVESAARELAIPLDDAYVAAGRLPPDIQADLYTAVALYRASVAVTHHS